MLPKEISVKKHVLPREISPGKLITYWAEIRKPIESAHVKTSDVHLFWIFTFWN